MTLGATVRHRGYARGRAEEALDYLAAAGFEIEHARRLKWGIVERVVAYKLVRDARGD